MIEELRNKLPEELVWNVLKYTEHPCATIMKEELERKAAERYREGVAEWERLETLGPDGIYRWVIPYLSTKMLLLLVRILATQVYSVLLVPSYKQ